VNWDTYRSCFKALERSTLRGGVIGLLLCPWFGVAAGLLGGVETEYPVGRLAHTAILGLNAAMSGFFLGMLAGAILGVWKRVALRRPSD